LELLWIIVGIALLFIPVFGWIYGPVVIGVGIALIVLRNSDTELEERKDTNPKGLKRKKS
jgi:Co/Zn/Cd efflux system component